MARLIYSGTLCNELNMTKNECNGNLLSAISDILNIEADVQALTKWYGIMPCWHHFHEAMGLSIH